MPKVTPTVFISHASADQSLAFTLKELLGRALENVAPGLKIFCSSDVGDIEGGKKWFDQIMNNLKRATACVAVMTPQSVYYSPWVAYEAGGAYLRFEMNPRRSRLFPVCAYGMTGGILPAPFNKLQVRDLAKQAEVQVFLREVAACLGRRSPKVPRTYIRALSEEAANGSPHWGYVSSALVGLRQQSSPFNLESLLKQASTDVFCAGFNLYHLATAPHLKKGIFEFLRQSARSVRLLISDPAARRGYGAWRQVGPDFLHDLQKSVRSFRAWLSEAARLKLKGSLEIHRAPFVALSVTCIDPEASGGQLIITPAIVGKPISADRPHFWVSRRRQPAVFAYYWDTYHELFKRSPPL